MPISSQPGLGAYFYARRTYRQGFAKVGAPTESSRSLQSKSNQHDSKDPFPLIVVPLL